MKQKGFGRIIAIALIAVLIIVAYYYFLKLIKEDFENTTFNQKIPILKQEPSQNKDYLEVDSLINYQVPEGFVKTINTPPPTPTLYNVEEVILETPGFQPGGGGMKATPGAVIAIRIDDAPFTQKDIEDALHPEGIEAQSDCQNPTLTKIGGSDAVTCERSPGVANGFNAMTVIYHNNRKFIISYGYVSDDKSYANAIQSFLKSITFKN